MIKGIRDPDHCPYGHEYTPENTYVNPKRGDKMCRTCMRNKSKANHRGISLDEYMRSLPDFDPPEQNKYKKWWLDRFTLEEIKEMATGLDI